MAKRHQLGTAKPKRAAASKSRIRNASKSSKGQPRAMGAGPGQQHEGMMTGGGSGY